MLALVLAAVIAFAATNIDDLFILLLFFGQGRRPSEVVAGQYVGFGGIVLSSLVVSAGALLVRHEWVGFLGLVPLAIGVKGLVAQRRGNHGAPDAARGARGVLAIAAVTFANGGDNIAVYAPLFARRSWPFLVAILAVFGVMVAVWCAIARCLLRVPLVASSLDRWGHWIAPIVLIGLGVYLCISQGAAAYVLSVMNR